MDAQKLARAPHLLSQIALELDGAAQAAREAAALSGRITAAGATAIAPGADADAAWVQAQQLFTRFDEAAQLLRDLRRTVDQAFEGHRPGEHGR